MFISYRICITIFPKEYIPMNQTTSTGKNSVGSKSYRIATLFLRIKEADALQSLHILSRQR
jgi:hypothetical protein